MALYRSRQGLPRAFRPPDATHPDYQPAQQLAMILAYPKSQPYYPEYCSSYQDVILTEGAIDASKGYTCRYPDLPSWDEAESFRLQATFTDATATGTYVWRLDNHRWDQWAGDWYGVMSFSMTPLRAW